MRTHHLRGQLGGNSPLREVGIAYLAQRLEILSERLFGDNLLTITSKLCSHNFSEKTSARVTIRAGVPDGMAERLPEGWGQGLEQWGTGPAFAINDSNAKFNLSACPIYLHQASPGEQGTGKGQTSQGAGQGRQVFPRGTQESQPKARGGESRANNRGSKMPEVSEHLHLDEQSGLPLVWLKTSPGECPQSALPSEERWPGQCENWWGWIVLWCILGNLLCFSCQRRNRPGRDNQRRKGHPAKESRVSGETASHVGKRRPSRGAGQKRGARGSAWESARPHCSKKRHKGQALFRALPRAPRFWPAPLRALSRALWGGRGFFGNR